MVAALDHSANVFLSFPQGIFGRLCSKKTAYAHKRLENQGFQDMIRGEISLVNWS